MANGTKWRVWSLDVWGEGAEAHVNDRRDVGTVEIEEGEALDYERAIIAALKADGHLYPHVTPGDLTIEADTSVINVDDARDGYPLFTLERV